MVEEGEPAPEFTAPLAGDFPLDEFSLDERLDDGPVVLAFFPGAFTRVCTEEMCTFRDELGDFEALEGDVYGVSVDSPAVLQEFKETHGLGFDLISDFNREVIRKYDVVLDDLGGLHGLAQRSVFVVDEDRTVSYKWHPGDPKRLPDVDAIKRELESL